MPTTSVGAPVVKRHYVGIDVTGAIDTVVWAALWNKKLLWTNLLNLVPTDPVDEKRMLDKNHPTLPMITAEAKHGGLNLADTIIAPCGLDAKFTDKNFNNPLEDMIANREFMKNFIMNPGVSVEDGQGHLTDESKNSTLTADVVYISSHGTSLGDMYSDEHEVEISGRGRVKGPVVLFAASQAADKRQKFSGVKWLILSNCNTLKEDVNQDWLEMMQDSSLRGILGFQDLSPGPEGSANINSRFINELAKGATFKDAWSKAVTEARIPDRWVVICRENAIADTIPLFNTNNLNEEQSRVIKRFTKQNEKTGGVELKAIKEPFEAFWVKHIPTNVNEERVKITSINRLEERNELNAGDIVSIDVSPPSELGTFSNETEIGITLHYIREDYPVRLDIKKMFIVNKVEGFRLGVARDDSVVLKDIITNLKKNSKDTWLLGIQEREIENVEITMTCLEIPKKLVRLYPLWIEVAISPPNENELPPNVQEKLLGKLRRGGSISVGKRVRNRT